MRISANRFAGIHVTDTGTAVELTDVLIDNTQTEVGSGDFGCGVMALTGSSVHLNRTRLSQNHSVGLLAADPTTRVQADHLLIDTTLPQADGTFGRGIGVEEGAAMHLTATRIHHNAAMGLFAEGVGTVLRGYGVLVDGTVGLAEKIDHGSGAMVQTAAKFSCTGCAVIDNRSFGVIAAKTTAVHLVGARIAHTRVNTSGQLGNGLFFDVAGGDNRIVASHLRGNHSSAIAFHGSGGLLSGSVLLDTAPGSYPVFNAGVDTGQVVALGDGLVAYFATLLTVKNSLLIGNPRAGIVLRNSNLIAIDGSLATGGYFGLVGDGGTPPLTAGSAFFGSTSNSASSSGLFVPLPPKFVP